MKKNLILPFFFILLVITGCGNSKIRELRAEFIEGCKHGGASRDVCSCVFDKMENNYSEDQLLDLKIGVIPIDFPEFTTKSTIQCTRDN
jgi:hypothetical protein